MGPVTSELKRGITQNGMVDCGTGRAYTYRNAVANATQHKKVVAEPFTRFWQKKKCKVAHQDLSKGVSR